MTSSAAAYPETKGLSHLRTDTVWSSARHQPRRRSSPHRGVAYRGFPAASRFPPRDQISSVNSVRKRSLPSQSCKARFPPPDRSESRLQLSLASSTSSVRPCKRHLHNVQLFPGSVGGKRRSALLVEHQLRRLSLGTKSEELRECQWTLPRAQPPSPRLRGLGCRILR